MARNNYSGLVAAQLAVTEWASNSLGDGVQVVGLVLIADAPGRRPRVLRELEQIVSGGAPQAWTLPWMESWRIGEAPTDDVLPARFNQLLADLSLTIPSTLARY